MATDGELLPKQGRYADLFQGQFFVADPILRDLSLVSDRETENAIDIDKINSLSIT
jgi:hypothetical protein